MEHIQTTLFVPYTADATHTNNLVCTLYSGWNTYNLVCAMYSGWNTYKQPCLCHIQRMEYIQTSLFVPYTANGIHTTELLCTLTNGWNTYNGTPLHPYQWMEYIQRNFFCRKGLSRKPYNLSELPSRIFIFQITLKVLPSQPKN